MAEMSEDEGDWQSYGQWLGGWIKTVKDSSVSALKVVKTQTASAVEMVKRDITELSEAIQCDTSNTTARLRENSGDDEDRGHSGRLRAGIDTFLGGISKMLMVEPDSDDESEEVLISRSGPVFDSAKARLQTLQLDPNTYVTEVVDVEDFHRWLENFVVDDHKGEISELLVTSAEIRSIYTQAVPMELSHSLFWQRYFYRLQRLQMEEMRRSQLKQRARTIETSMHEDINMGDDWVDFESPSSPTKPSFLELRMRQNDQILLEPEVITMSHDIPALSPVLQDDKESEPQLSSPSTEPFSSISNAAVSPESISEQQIFEIFPNSNVDDDGHTSNISERRFPKRIPEIVSLGVAEVMIAEPEEELEFCKPASLLTASVEDALKTDAAETDYTGNGVNPEGNDVEVELKTRVKGDMVLVGGRSGNTPTDSTDSNKDSVTSLADDDEWDDFDVEVTEVDIKVAEEMAKSLQVDNGDGNEEDWENWE